MTRTPLDRAPIPVRPRARTGSSALALAIAIGLAYAVGSVMAHRWFDADGANASFFPAAGVTMAALVALDRRWWPSVLVGAGVAEVLVDVAQGLPWGVSFGYAVANLAQPVVGGVVLTSWRGRIDLARVGHLAAFLAGGVLFAPLVGGLLGATVHVVWDGGASWFRFAAEWWVGDGLGVLVVGGTLLGLRASSSRGAVPARVPERVVLAAIAIVSTFVTFRADVFALVYLPLALLFVIAIRAGTRDVAVVGAVVAFVAAEGTARGHRFWETLEIDDGVGLLYLQLALGVIIGGALMMAAALAEREASTLARSTAEAAQNEAVVGRQRAEMLERHAARLAAAASMLEVAEATADGLAELGVRWSAVWRLGGSTMTMLADRGVADNDVDDYRDVPMSADLPLTEAARQGAVVACATRDELFHRYPGVEAAVANGSTTSVQSVVVVPLQTQNLLVIGALVVTSDECDWLTDTRRQLLISLADQCGLALDRAELQSRAERAASDAELLARLSDALDRSTTALERARHVVAELIARGVSAAAIELAVDPSDQDHRDQFDHDQKDQKDRKDRTDGTAPTKGAADARPSLDPQHPIGRGWTEAPQFDADHVVLAAAGAAHELLAPEVVVPLQARGRVLGRLVVSGSDALGAGRGLLQSIASRAAIAIDNALLYERERDVSHRLQLGLLGGSFPKVDGVRIEGAYRPGTATLDIGGDWHDAFVLPSGSLALVVGDVVGHGLDAAIAMAQLRGAVRAFAAVSSPTELLDRLDVFVDSMPAADMTTLVYVELDPWSGRFRYACAGHPPPLIVSATGVSRLLWGARSTPLGSQFGSRRVESIDALGDGERLVLYTDGLVERRGEQLDRGLQRLFDATAHDVASVDFVDRLCTHMLDGVLQRDDVCVLTATRLDERSYARSLSASPTELGMLRRELRAWLGEWVTDADDRRDVLLAVSEAVSNAIEHGVGGGSDRPIVVVATATGGDVVISVRDHGVWREPEPSTERGRGIGIMRALMDDVVVERHDDGTVIRLCRSIERERDLQG